MGEPIRVLGIGAPFGDDQLGWLAAQALENAFDAARVQVSWHDRPGARLVQLMQGAQRVILLDGVKSGAAVGTLHRLEGEAIYKAVGKYTSTHGFGLAEALQLADKLAQLPPQVVLFGVEIADCNGAGLSPAVDQALPRLLEAVMTEIGAATGGLCAP